METGLVPQPSPRPRRLLRSLRAVTKTKELGSHLAAPRHKSTQAPRAPLGSDQTRPQGLRLQNEGWRTVGSGSPPDFITATGHFQKRVQRQPREPFFTEGFLNVLGTEGKGKHVKRKGNILQFSPEIKLNILERSPRCETDHRGSLKSAGAGTLDHAKAPGGCSPPADPHHHAEELGRAPELQLPDGRAHPRRPEPH